jgi:hypothetical protein
LATGCRARQAAGRNDTGLTDATAAQHGDVKAAATRRTSTRDGHDACARRCWHAAGHHPVVGSFPARPPPARPTDPHPRGGFWEEAVVDLSGDEAEPIPEPDPDDVLDLADEVLDLVDDVDDRTRRCP